MSDNLDREDQKTLKKINVNQAWEVRYWCEKLGLTESELRAAVKAVGNIVVDAEAYVAKLRNDKSSSPSMGM